MMDKLRLSFQKGDFLAIGLVLLLAAAVALLFLPGQTGQNAVAVIYRNGKQVAQLPLNEDGSFVVEGTYTNVVSVQGGSVRMTQSDCPGQDCVHSSPISAPGRSIVCLPNQVEVRVLAGESGVDFVVG